MGHLRKILWWVFVCLYLVIAPLTVLYALGYIFNPGEQTLLRTGLVSLQSHPSEARIRINGLDTQEKTPAVFRNLKPGSYEIELELPGYQSWGKRVRIEREKALRFENILLFPRALVPEQITGEPVTRLEMSLSENSLLVLRGQAAGGLSVFKPADARWIPLNPGPAYSDFDVRDLWVHPAGDSAIVTLEKNSIRTALWIRWAENNLLVNEIPLPAGVSSLQWSTLEKDRIFFLEKGALRRLELDRGEIFPVTAEKVLGVRPYARHLFVLTAHPRLVQFTEKGRFRGGLLKDPAKIRIVFGKKHEVPYSLFFYPPESFFFAPENTLLILLSGEGRLACNKLPYFLDDDVKEMTLAEESPLLLYRKDHEIWEVDFERAKLEAFFENGPSPLRIYTASESPENLKWFYRNRYFLFTAEGKLWAKDRDPETKAIPLVSLSPKVSQIALDRDSGFVYYAHPVTGKLMRVQLHEPLGLLPRLGDNTVRDPEKKP